MSVFAISDKFQQNNISSLEEESAMYRYLLKGKAQVTLFLILLCMSSVAGTLFALVMSALVDCTQKGGKKVLRQLSLRLEAGKHYAIVGSSGSGKSTLLSLLLGYYPGYDGKIYFDRVELNTLKRDALGEMIGVVSQDTFLFNDSIYNNIALYQDGYAKEEVVSAIRQTGLGELLDSLPDGVSTMICENGKNFSGGEKQRFSLARVILRKKKVLLLDEFTANMDEATAREIEERMLSWKDAMIVTVTHRLNPQILRRYDKILVLSQGSIVESGSYDELMAVEGYFKKMAIG